MIALGSDPLRREAVLVALVAAVVAAFAARASFRPVLDPPAPRAQVPAATLSLEPSLSHAMAGVVAAGTF